jgi:hypothetical protein
MYRDWLCFLVEFLVIILQLDWNKIKKKHK